MVTFLIVCFKEVDETLAKKLADDYLRQYTTMKRCSKEYDSFSRQLNKLSPAIPPRGTTQEHTQVINITHSSNMSPHSSIPVTIMEEIFNVGKK